MSDFIKAAGLFSCCNTKFLYTEVFGRHRQLIFFIGALLFLWSPPSEAVSKVSVNTIHGPVLGTKSSDGVMAFKGIRYGVDTSVNRFMPAKKPESWTNVFHADTYGADCPQPKSLNMSEDCLFLNVWTETLKQAQKPVIFYIHGGAYSHGSGSDPLYDGTYLAQNDLVVVTVNHRLGLLGYGYFNQLGAPEEWQYSGNVGQLDLILALKWVQANITRFGGDPANVTVVGQSGGGGKIATLMAMPAAKGLFHKAVTMSGQQVTASGPLNAIKRTKAILSALKLDNNNIYDLATLPVGKLLEASKQTDPVLGYGGLYFGPVLDMRSLFRHPFYPDAAPQSGHIPMIIGNTLDETRLFLSGIDEHHTLTWETLPAYLAPNMRVDIDPYYVRDRYRELFPYFSASEIFFRATTVARSWRAAIIEAEERAKQKAPTWVYQLNWQSPKDGGKWRAPHTIDIPLIFGTTHVSHALSGNGAEARQMAGVMSNMLIQFAKNGSPQTTAMPKWPEFDVIDRPTMIMDLPPRIEHDPRGAERKIFQVVPYIQPGS